MNKTSITIEDIEASIKDEQALKVGAKTTIVLLTLDNGFEVVGTSACVDAKNYDAEIGLKIARENAIKQIWAMKGYALQERLYFTGKNNE